MLRKSSICMAIAAALTCQQAFAEGYKLFEQSVSSMGNAYAGRGAQITDATLVYSNPAALTQLQGAQLSGGINYIAARTNYRNAEAYSAQGAPVVGRSEGKISLNELIPFVFYSDHISEQLSWGIGFYVPYGLSSDYQQDWVGRYFADETAIEVLSLQPTLAYKVTDIFSVGLGISVNRVSGTLSKFKDHSGLCEMGTAINDLAGGADIYNDAYCNSHYQVEGDDIAFGYTLGLHSEPVSGTRLALVYHSAVRYTLKGDSEITNTPITGANVAGNPGYMVIAPHLPAVDLSTGKLAANDYLTEASKLSLTTPATLTFSIDQQVTPELSLQFSANWTEWSEFRSIDIVSDDANPSISLNTQLPQNLNAEGYIGYIPEQWRNVWAFAVGATYQYRPDLALKAGIAYDENPIQDSHRTARVPTTDRTWLTVGSNWKLAENMSMDFAYGYLFTSDTAINEHEYNVQNVALYNSNLKADYSNKAQVVAVQFNYTF
ncbi:outer membrane protein transport protein [Chromatiaceae bacterium AAb-1]|nr:outer membrane protein transport protein [Chromatiaceae bacterium AAb-1]